MQFKFTADVIFDAVDIDDAIDKLRIHFLRVQCGISDEFITSGNICIEPTQNNTQVKE